MGAGQTVTSTPRQDDSPSGSIPEEARLQVGFRGLIGVPVGDFTENVGTTGGLVDDFGYRLGDSLVRLGVAVGVLCEGGGTRHDPVRVDGGVWGSERPAPTAQNQGLQPVPRRRGSS